MAKVGTIEVEITNKVKGMTTCKICGRDFPLLSEDHYVAVDADKTGIAEVVSHTEPQLFDAIDCPHCGCQNVLQERKRVCPCEYGICDECEEEEDEDE